jgi:hypothetical protein
MADDKASAPSATYDKGDRVAIVGGRQGIGERCEVFWIGENKYGPGMRYGVKNESGTTYWVDESDVVAEANAGDVPKPAPKPAGEGASFERGDHVVIIDGPDKGQKGEVFWTGASRYSNQSRYGIKSGEDTFWADANQVEASPDQPKRKSEPPRERRPSDGPRERESTSAPPIDDEPRPDDDLPPEAYDDGIPEDDIPF